MRRLIVVMAMVCLAVLVAGPAAARGPNRTDAQRRVLALGGQVAQKATNVQKAPRGPNPYLSLVPDPSTVDYSGWRRYIQRMSQERAAMLRAAQAPLIVDEDEPAGTRGSNDTTATAQPVRGFGTRPSRENRARILGALSPEVVPTDDIPATPEDDGSIPLAGDTGIGTVSDGITVSAEIGDGPHGSAGSDSGDFDFYALEGVAGDLLVADVDTPSGDLDPMIAVYNSAGENVAFNDDFEDFDSRVEYLIEADDTYYVAMTGFFVLPADPFDSGSGDGSGSEGPYDLTITTGEPDYDFYSVKLRKGDVLGASVSGAAARIALYDSAAVEVMGSTQDATFIYSPQSPLPGGGNAVADHVAQQRGRHYIGVASGGGGYDITVEAYRSPLTRQDEVQTLFLDFNGERVNTGIFGGPGVRTLSPLRAFLGRWGLTNGDRDALIDQIVRTVRENITRDVRRSGVNPNLRIRILNSRDDPDPFGEENVSRVIVGGTIEQSGIPTIGIAQTIDPGNFGTEETALVLLDVVSDPAGELGDPSFNTYIAPSSDRVAFIGTALGNIVSHEAGHYFGNFHVDQFNIKPT